MKILVVDDEPSARHLMEKWLRKNNHEVCLAASGEAAMQVIKAEWYVKPIDLVLLDINLGPGIDGIEVSRRLKEHPVLCITPVIILAAETPEEIRRRAMASVNAIESVRLVLQKPINLQTLEKAISLIEPFVDER